MTASVYSLPRPASGGRPPLVPAKVRVHDAPDFRFPISLLDSEWYHSCSREEALAGINLQARAIHQQGGSLPSADAQLARLADFGRDVDGWLAAKDKALEGWSLCSDDRYHHPEVARNVLHIWIGRLERRRASAFGNASKDAEDDYGLGSIQEDIEEALEALRAIDPQDLVLREAGKRVSMWRPKIVGLLASRGGSLSDAASAEPIRLPNRNPNRQPLGGGPKVSEAKRSQSDSSSLQSRDDSSNRINPTLETEGMEGSVKRTDRGTQVLPWPSGWLASFKAVYPRREAWGDAEKVLERIRKAAKVPFEEIIAGAERLAARVASSELSLEFTPTPARWLNGRRWEDEPPRVAPRPGASTSGVPAARSTQGIPSAEDGFALGLDLAYGRGPPSDPACGPVIDHEPVGDP